ESLYLCTARRIVMICFSVGSGIGPDTPAPVRLAVSTIFSADWSSTRWSYAFKRMRIFCLAFAIEVPPSIAQFENRTYSAGTTRAPSGMPSYGKGAGCVVGNLPHHRVYRPTFIIVAEAPWECN